jgi:signal transduction histidine kinase
MEVKKETQAPETDAQLLARLAGGLAHEIKNPLSTMAINLALLQEEWERAGIEDQPHVRRSLKRVRTLQSEVSRLESILEEFLAFARGGRVNRAPEDLSRIVREVLDFVEPENQRQEIRQHADLLAGMPLVLVDETQIKQAILNLLVNARQAMPEGGELLVRTERLGNDMRLTVTDTGVGMTPGELERCFEVFWSNKKGGTGLGLASARRIVEEHGGSLSAVSELGRGTSFALLLPLAVELLPRTPKEAEETGGNGSDDEEAGASD